MTSPPITSAPMSQTSPWPPWPVDENGMTPPPQGHHVSNLSIRLRFESDSGRRPTDTEPGFHERHAGFIGFHQLDILCYMFQKIMPGIISTIQWGNNPWCWIHREQTQGVKVNNFFSVGSQETVGSSSKGHRGSRWRLKQLVYLKLARNMMINQKPPLVTIHLWTERGVNPDKTFG